MFLLKQFQRLSIIGLFVFNSKIHSINFTILLNMPQTMSDTYNRNKKLNQCNILNYYNLISHTFWLNPITMTKCSKIRQEVILNYYDHSYDSHLSLDILNSLDEQTGEHAGLL